VLAQKAMIEGGLKKKKRQNKALIDQISAVIILQSYLESKKNNANIKL
jgi:putative Holliday junction resolvase